MADTTFDELRQLLESSGYALRITHDGVITVQGRDDGLGTYYTTSDVGRLRQWMARHGVSGHDVPSELAC